MFVCLFLVILVEMTLLYQYKNDSLCLIENHTLYNWTRVGVSLVLMMFYLFFTFYNLDIMKKDLNFLYNQYKHRMIVMMFIPIIDMIA